MFVYLLIFVSDLANRAKNRVCEAVQQTSVMRCSDLLSAEIWIAVFQLQRPCAHSLTSALHCMAPVRPRRQIVYPRRELGLNAPSERLSEDQVGDSSGSRREARCQLAQGPGRWAGTALPVLTGCSLITAAVPAAWHTLAAGAEPSCSVLTPWQCLSQPPSACRTLCLLLSPVSYRALPAEKMCHAFGSFCTNRLSTFQFSVPKSAFFRARDTLQVPKWLNSKGKGCFH